MEIKLCKVTNELISLSLSVADIPLIEDKRNRDSRQLIAREIVSAAAYVATLGLGIEDGNSDSKIENNTYRSGLQPLCV